MGGMARLSRKEVAKLQNAIDDEIEHKRVWKRVAHKQEARLVEEIKITNAEGQLKYFYSKNLLTQVLGQPVKNDITVEVKVPQALPTYESPADLAVAHKPPWWAYLLIWWLGDWLGRRYGTTVPVPNYHNISYMEWKMELGPPWRKVTWR